MQAKRLVLLSADPGVRSHRGSSVENRRRVCCSARPSCLSFRRCHQNRRSLSILETITPGACRVYDLGLTLHGFIFRVYRT